MNLGEFRKLTANCHDSLELVIVATNPARSAGGSRGGTLPKVESISNGFDHDSGFIFIKPDIKVEAKRKAKKRVCLSCKKKALRLSNCCESHGPNAKRI